MGAKFYDLFKDFKKNEYNLNSDSINNEHKNLIGNFLHGLKLKSYVFEKYKTKKSKIKISMTVTGRNIPSLINLNNLKLLKKELFILEIWFLSLEIFYIQMNIQKD